MMDEMWECDLNVMEDWAKYNDGYKYMLVVIDVLSRYLMVEPLKTKNADDIVAAFAVIFKKGRTPKMMRSDQGKEFVGKKTQSYLKQMNVRFFMTNNETKACFCERVIRTLKARMFRYFQHKQTYRYIDILKDLVDSYNHSFHRSIKMAPVSVTKDNDHLAWENTYVKTLQDDTKIKFRFQCHLEMNFAFQNLVGV